MSVKRVLAKFVASAVLVGGVGTGVGAAVTTSAGASTGASTAEAVGAWAPEWMTGKMKDYTRSEAIAVAERYDVIAALAQTFKGHADAMRAANPDLEILAYVNGPFATTWGDGYPESWYAHDAAGNRVRSARFGNDLMNVHRGEWHGELVDLCTAAIDRSGYDGCFLDTMGNGIFNGGYLDGHPVDPRTGRAWDPNTFIADTAHAARHVASTLDVTVALNGLGNGSRYFNSGGAALADSTDMAMAEAFLRHPSAPATEFPSERRWRNEVEMIRHLETTRTDFLGVTKLWTETTPAQRRQWFDFASATIALATDGSARLFFIEDGCVRPCDGLSSPLVDQPVTAASLGAPTGDYRSDNGIYLRSFAKGLAVVNPSETSKVLRFTGTYVDQRGRSHTKTLTVPAHTGWLLERSTTPSHASSTFTETHADVMRLYHAFFARKPDRKGAEYWAGVVDGGRTLDEIAEYFAQSPEFERRYAGTSSRTYLEAVYGNVLGRSYDQGGFDYWLGQMRRGLSRGGVVRWVASSPEFKRKHVYTALPS